jgi:hypothetical protein
MKFLQTQQTKEELSLRRARGRNDVGFSAVTAPKGSAAQSELDAASVIFAESAFQTHKKQVCSAVALNVHKRSFERLSKPARDTFYSIVGRKGALQDLALLRARLRHQGVMVSGNNELNMWLYLSQRNHGKIYTRLMKLKARCPGWRHDFDTRYYCPRAKCWREAQVLVDPKLPGVQVSRSRAATSCRRVRCPTELNISYVI